MPRTASDAASLVFHEWTKAQTLAGKLELIIAAFDGCMANIKDLDLPASDVPGFCQFLRDELGSLYSDAGCLEDDLSHAARVLHYKLPR